MTERDGYAFCDYCQSRYALDSADAIAGSTTIGVTSEVEAVLKNFEDDPANRQHVEKYGSSSSAVSDAKGGTIDPISEALSSKSWKVALVLSVLFGMLGVDRFYLGQFRLGILKWLTAGGCGVWWLIDIRLIALKRVKDSEGHILQ